MIRLFIAIPLPEQIRTRLALIQSGLQGARWITPENMHMTLRFIGDVPNDVAADVDAALSAVQMTEFSLSLDGIGSFNRGKAPHTLWAGTPKHEPLMRLQAKVETAVVRAGLPPQDRKFSPHVTLARLRDVKRSRVEAWAAENGGFRAGPFTVDRFVLFSSYLSSEGAIYTPEAEYALEV